ncbi:MAG: hypothetical protein ACRD2E_14475 [Terriglobales bacterium]
MITTAAVLAAQSPASAAHASQPQWITPLVTFTPLLEQEYRFDFDADSLAAGAQQNYGGSKGLELIPWARTEVVIGEPGYQAGAPGRPSGWDDLSGAVKYRLTAASPGRGDYVVTLFLTATAPTGTPGLSLGVASLTPGIGLGKGWGRWDVQSTVQGTYYHHRSGTLGTPIAWNTALQYHFGRYAWPELELSPEWWASGLRSGKTQMVVTPGVVIGKIPLDGRLGLTFGAGEEFATTAVQSFRRRFVFTLRLPF